MNAKTLEAVRRHGESLLAAFPNAIERDPVALCKKLRRIELAVGKPILDYCNGSGPETDAALTRAIRQAMDRVMTLLGLDAAQVETVGLHVNLDPRGYALKLDKPPKGARLFLDWGGYGILAPDLTVGRGTA